MTDHLPVNSSSDPVENAESRLRDAAGPKACFTRYQFPSCFGTVLINMLSDSSGVQNCRDDNAVSLLKVYSFLEAANEAEGRRICVDEAQSRTQTEAIQFCEHNAENEQVVKDPILTGIPDSSVEAASCSKTVAPIV